jgi:hypothetical protein
MAQSDEKNSKTRGGVQRAGSLLVGRQPWHVKLREECTSPYSPEYKG